MEQAYLIIEPSVRLADIVRAIYFYRWDWKDEVKETANAPYTRLYIDQSGVRIFYREEHKDVFSARYFYAGKRDNNAKKRDERAANRLYRSHRQAAAGGGLVRQAHQHAF